MATLAGFEPCDLLRDRQAGTAKLPHRAMVGREGVEPPKSEDDWFTASLL